MGFTPTNDNLSDREPWLNSYFNTLIDDIQTALSNLNGNDFEDDAIVLSRSNQELDGGNKNIHSFKRWFGNGSATIDTWRDITAFGADGSDSTDDSSAIQSAIDDLPAGGGVVLCPPGTYTIGTKIDFAGSDATVRSNVMLFCSGWSTIFKADTNLDDHVFRMGRSTSSGHILYNCKVDGNKANQGAGDWHCIDIEDATDSLVWRVWCADAKGSGIAIDGNTNLIIEKPKFTGITDAGIYVPTGAAANTNIQIKQFFIDTPGLQGIDMTPAPADLSITEGRIKDAGSEGILLKTTASASINDVSISEVIIDNAGSQGVHVSSGVGGSTVSDLHIVNCTIKNCTGAGMEIDGGSTAEITDVSITANKIHDNGGNGIELVEGVEHAVISANTVKDNCQSSGDSGISLQGTSGSKVQYAVITGNSIIDTQGTPTQDYGIRFQSNTEQCGAFGNSVSGAGTDNISDAGTDNDVSHNLGDT